MWEWVQDWYTPDYYVTNPGGQPNETDTGLRVLRGGAWDSAADDLRTTARFAAVPTIRFERISEELLYRGVGFRCAMDVIPDA